MKHEDEDEDAPDKVLINRTRKPHCIYSQIRSGLVESSKILNPNWKCTDLVWSKRWRSTYSCGKENWKRKKGKTYNDRILYKSQAGMVRLRLARKKLLRWMMSMIWWTSWTLSWWCSCHVIDTIANKSVDSKDNYNREYVANIYGYNWKDTNY